MLDKSTSLGSSPDYRRYFRDKTARLIGWARLHKIRAVLYGLGCLVLLEYLSLPNARLAERSEEHTSELQSQR